MKKILIVVTMFWFIFLVSCSRSDKYSPAARDAPLGSVPDLVGEYAVNGFDPMGTEYGGRLSIWAGEIQNEYLMQWIVVGGIQVGTGVVHGNQLLVEWHSVEGMVVTQGQAIYTITEDGELYGAKTVDGLEAEGSEIAFPNE
jgi:hypothetical protein